MQNQIGVVESWFPTPAGRIRGFDRRANGDQKGGGDRSKGKRQSQEWRKGLPFFRPRWGEKTKLRWRQRRRNVWRAGQVMG
nr:hypothetical protein Iba_chr01aCG7240 [Ipomoea batatas]